MFVLFTASTAFAQYSVRASWDRNADSHTAGYRIYYGTSSGSYQWSLDVGNQTSAPLNLAAGRYYFTVRAYTSGYRYGPASNEATISVGSATSPPTAAIQASLSTSTSALVRWQTSNAVSASINGVTVPVTGSTTISISGTTTFTLTARSSTGATATASATVTVSNTTTAPPQPPTSMAANVSGTRVTLSWRPNASGGPPADYLLYVGTYSWGSNVIRARSVGNVLTVSSDLRPGTYYARVRARNRYGTSYSSSQVRFRVGTTLASPTGFTASWQGTQATLSWVASAADSEDKVPSQYIVEAGSGPGLADIATVPLTGTTFSAEIPRGVYYVRIRAVNPRGDSDPTRDLVLAAPGTAAAPRELTAGGSGSRVELSWTPPANGEPPVGYVIEAGSEPGLSDIASLRVGNVTQFATDAPPGTYFIRVRAVNGRGPGFHSNEVVVQK